MYSHVPHSSQKARSTWNIRPQGVLKLFRRISYLKEPPGCADGLGIRSKNTTTDSNDTCNNNNNTKNNTNVSN